MTFGKSTTPVVFEVTFKSVERVSGQKPCFVARSVYRVRDYAAAAPQCSYHYAPSVARCQSAKFRERRAAAGLARL
jgi:hypothetical protein